MSIPSRIRSLRHFHGLAGPVAIILTCFLIGMLWLSACRLLFYAIQHERLADLSQPWALLLVGLRMDSVT
ncbi:MAG: hypothetical protein ACRES4_09425, partial [Nevskiales bacterium]